MKIKVLGASGSEVPGHRCPAFLIDGRILLDAGTVCVSLTIAEQRAIREILITHAHFDHIKGIPFLLDNMAFPNTGKTITIFSGRDVLDDLRKNIFNDRIWPDFTRIPSTRRPVLRYFALSPSRAAAIGRYRVWMEKVSHTVPAYGFIAENAGRKAIAYAGDTGPTERFWRKMAGRNVVCLIVETSFPNRLKKKALATGHLTPSLLEKEIAKMRIPPGKICAVHLKPQFYPEIREEIGALTRIDIVLPAEGDVISV
ncbi:MAG: 3',5'-cyclic-nucleotide phosphodiesterase [Deltaproteobacteria bacterium]|nr:3',5'-cyclic-nucleotide phosphodiesterase [Deltaproteobacteria bacterium]